MVLRMASKEVTSFSEGANPFGRLSGKQSFNPRPSRFLIKLNDARTRSFSQYMEMISH